MKPVVIFTKENLLRLKEEAEALLAEASPFSAGILNVLKSFSVDEIEFCASKRQFPQEAVETVAMKADTTPLVVRQVLVGSVMPGLEDYSSYFQRCREFFETGHYAAKVLKEELERNGQRRPFVLHRRLGTWEIYKGDLGWCLFEDGSFSAACQGYLVSEGRAFINVVELLRASRQQNWPKWQSLWKYF